MKEFNHINVTLTTPTGGKDSTVGIEKNSCFVVISEMDYSSSLNAIGQQRYTDKLCFLDISVQNPHHQI